MRDPAFPRRSDLVGEMLTELARPLSDSFVGDNDAAGRQQLLNHTKPERETEIERNGMADDLGPGTYTRRRGREPMSSSPPDYSP